MALFLSTPSARRATRVVAGACLGLDISIHALREEGDLRSSSRRPKLPISIHALREEGDVNFQTDYDKRVEFLSTP